MKLDHKQLFLIVLSSTMIALIATFLIVPNDSSSKEPIAIDMDELVETLYYEPVNTGKYVGGRYIVSGKIETVTDLDHSCRVTVGYDTKEIDAMMTADFPLDLADTLHSYEIGSDITFEGTFSNGPLWVDCKIAK